MRASDARAIVLDVAGPELLERLEHLDALPVANRQKPPPRPPRGARADVDVVVGGGGLSLLHAVVLARAGLRVAVVERARAGAAHREWNASRRELDALSRAAIASALEIDTELVVARYARGVCRWHRGGEHAVTGVLDCAVDAAKLLALARSRAEALGVEFIESTEVAGHAADESGVALALEPASPEATNRSPRTIVARAFVDARGVSSPFATADLVCPTVGGVLSELDEGDGPMRVRRDVGEILVTTEDVEDGHQHLWEAFPGRPGETTVYLFYYARSARRAPGALAALYARFFRTLHRYKSGDARLVRPTFGFIPGWSRLAPPPSSDHARVLLVGDAAARHSPLTFCGFGATLRSLSRGPQAVIRAIEGGRGAEIAHDAAIHAGTGALSLMLASVREERDAAWPNDLLDAAFSSLTRMGNDAYARLLRDEMDLAEFVEFLRATAAARPRVYFEIVRRLGPLALARWGASLARQLAVV
ncbi:MAG: FAD-dependent monooxygenase [Polyangiaceae bacterium]